MAFKLEPNEYIVIIARRHWFSSVLQTLGLMFSLLIPVFVTSLVFALPDRVEQLGNTGILTIIILISWFFIIWNIAFVIWTNHFLDVLVITNLHIIDIEQVGLWHRQISTVQLQKVQDISSKTEGIIASILNYGELEIQSAGSLTNFIVKGIQKPDLIRQKMNQQISALHSSTIYN
jgi:signal transduction histidine kinase